MLMTARARPGQSRSQKLHPVAHADDSNPRTWITISCLPGALAGKVDQTHEVAKTTVTKCPKEMWTSHTTTSPASPMGHNVQVHYF